MTLNIFLNGIIKMSGLTPLYFSQKIFSTKMTGLTPLNLQNATGDIRATPLHCPQKILSTKMTGPTPLILQNGMEDTKGIAPKSS